MGDQQLAIRLGCVLRSAVRCLRVLVEGTSLELGSPDPYQLKRNVVPLGQGVQGLMMAIWQRGKPDALLHHSDQGSRYSSEQLQKLLADHGTSCSMSRSGNVWDNAAMESFFSPLIKEQITRKVYRTRNQARADVFDSTIEYRSPMKFERIKASS